MSNKRKGSSEQADINKKLKRQADEKQQQKAMSGAPELPDVAIYQILRSLSTRQAIRASAVSKHWGHGLPFVSVLDFDEIENQRLNHQNFIDFVTSYLNRLSKDKFLSSLQLDKFRLRMHQYYGCFDPICKWLSFAVERNVKELCISTVKKASQDKSTTLLLNKAKSLTVLNLERVSLRDFFSTDDPVGLASLKSMSLKHVSLWDFDFLRLISECPSIENLWLNSCSVGRPILTVSSSTLKCLKVTMDYNQYIYAIKVVAENLESCKLQGVVFGMIRCNIVEFVSCGALRTLELTYIQLVNNVWLEEGFDSKFPLLESLSLYNCYGLGRMNVCSPHLKRFVLDRSTVDPIENARIDCPNLQYFGFCGRVTYAETNVLMNVPNLAEATILLAMEPTPNFKSSCKIRNFLANFDCCGKVLTIHADNPTALIFPENMRQEYSPPLPSLKHLKVISTKNDFDLRDSLHWMAPSLEDLSVKECSHEDMISETNREYKKMRASK